MRFICMLNRTGSNWLCDMLSKLPLGYKAGEWFNAKNKWAPFERESLDKAAHWRLLCEPSPGDDARVIVKCNISQMRLFEEEVLAAGQQHRYVFLERKNLVAQAISQFILQVRLAGDTPSIGCLDPVVVTDLVAKYGKANGVWRRWLEENAGDYHALAYEDMVADPGREVRRVVEHLDGPDLLELIPEGFDYAGARRKNRVPFIDQWHEAMERYAAGDDSWREVLEEEVEGEMYLS